MTNPLVAAARARLGTPFRHLGRSDVAADCVGFGKLIYSDCGVELAVPRHYGREPYRGRLEEALRQALGDPLAEGATAQKFDLKAGDICTFRFREEPHHVGLIADAPYAGALTLIHADSSPGVRKVVEHRLDDWWRARITAVYRRPVVSLGGPIGGNYG